MSLIKNKTLIIALALAHAYSSTALDSVGGVTPTSLGQGADKKTQFHKIAANIADKYPKAMKYEPDDSHSHAYPGFTPYEVKKILVIFEDREIDLKTIDEFVSSKITTKDLHEMKNRVIDYFIDRDYLIPQVHFHYQEAKAGILKISVHADSIHKVIVLGEGENNSLMQEYANKITSSSPAQRSLVQRYLGLMNKIPGYEISYKLVENKSHENELVIETISKKVAIFAGADNYGIKDTGKYQFNVLGEIYNPFSSRDALILHGSTSNNPSRMNDVGVGYKNIFNSYGTTINLFAAHNSDNPKNATIASNSNKGKGYSLRGAITHPLFVAARQDLELELGAHYHNYKSKILQNNISQNYKNTKYTTSDLGLNYSFKDGLEAKNIFKTSFVYNLQGKFSNNIVPGDVASKHFKIFKISLLRDQPLPNDFSIFAHLAASSSSDNLPDEEKAIFGGHEFGRGYDTAILDGNKMYAGTLEFRYTYQITDSEMAKNFQPYIYFDTGNIKQKYYTNPTTTKLSSAGVGIRAKFVNNFDFGMEIGKPFKKNIFVNSVPTKAKTRFNIFINKIFEF